MLILQMLLKEKNKNQDLPKINVIHCLNNDPCLHQDEINKSIIINQVINETKIFSIFLKFLQGKCHNLYSTKSKIFATRHYKAQSHNQVP